MDLLRREDIAPLLEPSGETCISIYIPSARAGVETLQNPVRFKNRIREAERRLGEPDVRPAEVKELLAPLKALVDDYEFWQHQGDGLAVFRSGGRFAHYRLPLAFDELVAVSKRFHLKPLLRMFAWESRFYVIAVGRHSVRLMDCTRLGAQELPLPESMPRSLAEAVAATDVEARMQARSAGLRTEGGRQGPFRGHGGGVEDGKDDLTRYFREVDRGIRSVLRDAHAPLIFAGLEFPVYRSVNTYPHLAGEAVAVNVEGMRPGEIRQRALAAIEPLLATSEEKAAAKYSRHLAAGRASGDIEQIVDAARHGRVDVLFVAERLQGREPAASEDQLEQAAIQTILHGGTVFPMKQARVPEGKAAAAVFRY